MIYREIPGQFNPKFEVVSCFVESENKILLLRRLTHKSEGDKWGIPAGKLDNGENLDEAMFRELREETGLVVRKEVISYLDKVYVRYPDYDFIFHMYKTCFNKVPNITLNPSEHQGYKWIEPVRSAELNLVNDLGSCIDLFYKN